MEKSKIQIKYEKMRAIILSCKTKQHYESMYRLYTFISNQECTHLFIGYDYLLLLAGLVDEKKKEIFLTIN